MQILKSGQSEKMKVTLVDPATGLEYVAGTPPSKYATPQGDWDANTNTPALGTGIGADGDYYRVSVAGTTAFDFVSSPQVPDIVYRQNGQWFIDRYSASASSVFVNNPVGNPVPVNLVQASGTAINITAGDINVGLTDTGANYDSVRIGDGTDLLAVNTDGSINVTDTIPLAEQDFGVTTTSRRSASVIGNTTGQLDYNIGAPTAQTLRTASVLSNTTGQVDYNVGVSTAQTLRSASLIHDGVDTMAVNTDGSINTTETIIAGQQDFGVTTNSKRNASVLGNSTGQIDYNVGVPTAQTIRTAGVVTDGVDTMLVNTDGSINVTLVQGNLAKIKNANDYTETHTYLDAGTSNERISTIVYSSVALGLSVTKTFNWSGVAGAYYINNIVLS